MAVVQLNSTDVGLQGVHGLVLLLIEHPNSKGKTSQFASLSQPRPMSSVALKSLHSMFLGLRAHTVLKRQTSIDCFFSFPQKAKEISIPEIPTDLYNMILFLPLPYGAPGVSTGL